MKSTSKVLVVFFVLTLAVMCQPAHAYAWWSGGCYHPGVYVSAGWHPGYWGGYGWYHPGVYVAAGPTWAPGWHGYWIPGHYAWNGYWVPGHYAY